MHPRRTLRIALAEDDDVQRAILEEALRLEGFDVVPFEDGDELIDYFGLPPNRVRWPDALVTDVSMPGHTGLEAAAAARKAGFKAPIFIITGVHTRQIQEQAAQLGNALLLLKPLEVEELAQAIWHLAHVTSTPPPRSSGS